MALRSAARLMGLGFVPGRSGASAAAASPALCNSFSSLDNEHEQSSDSSVQQVEQFVRNRQASGLGLPLGLGHAKSALLGGTRLSLATQTMPWAASQAMSMSSVPQVQSGSTVNSLLLGVYRFWRSQGVFDKAPAPVDARMLPGIIAASDERAAIGTWCTALFCTILSCNLLGLVPFNEAPTAGLGFSTGLGVSVWATATILGFYKLGFSFPGHFIPGGTPWPMAFIFVPLETISYSFRAVSLGVRLWVNMLAGHTLLHILTGMSLALPFSLPFYTGLPVTFAVCCLLSALVGLEYLGWLVKVHWHQEQRGVRYNHERSKGPVAHEG
ncbi:F1F0 ATP synthase subunit 6 [Haematococcus lacustris]|uniref:F-ATPase protein 6 n=1 Tax=Haematococcus lacustris TaxID=44745 RepID=A0A699Z097_HAELA|nr:F1F0 ATP synthase subunit 6 [Haematococcus lacustris]